MLRDLAHLFRRPFSFLGLLGKGNRPAHLQSRKTGLSGEPVFRRLCVERLEDRTLLSGLVSYSLSGAQQQALSAGLQGIAQMGTNLDQYAQLGQIMSVVDQSLGSVLNIGNILQNHLASPLESVLPGGNITQTTDNVITAITQLGYSANGLTVTVNPNSVSGGELVSANEIQFNLVLDATSTRTTDLDLGAGAAQYGLSVNSSASVQLTTNLVFGFTFGLDLTPGLPPSDQFFLSVQNLTASASAQMSNANFGGRVGFLGVGVQNASINLNADVTATFTNPNPSVNNLTLTALQDNSVGAIVSLAASNASLTATLPLQASLGAWTASGNPTVTISSSNVFGGAAPAVTPNSDFGMLLPFDRLTPSDFTHLFQQLGSGLNGIAPGLNVPGSSGLPFLGEQLSQLVNFNTMASNLSAGLPTIQVLQGKTNAPANGQLSADADFSITVGSQAAVPVTVTAVSTQQNQDIASLVGDINAALTTAGLSGQITAVQNGDTVELESVVGLGQFQIQITDPANPAATALGFSSEQTSSAIFDFNTIQTLVPLLASVMGVSASQLNPQYNSATQSLSFVLDYQSQFQQTLPLSFGTTVAPLNFDETASATVAATATLNATFGVNLGGLQTVLTGTAAAPSNGQLSADAHFALAIGGSTPVNVTVTAAATQNNHSLDDLVGDLNAALAAAGVGNEVVAGSSGGLITLTDSNGVSLQVTASASDPTITQLYLPTQGAIPDYADNVYLASGATLTVSTSVTASNINGSAALGILAVGVRGGNVSVSADTGVTVGSTGQVSLRSLGQGATGQLTVQPIQATLSGLLPLTVTGVNTQVNNSAPSLSLSLGTANNLTTLTATPNSALQNLVNGFATLTPGNVGQALQDVSGLLQGSSVGAFNTPLPLLNQSLNTLLGTSGLFGSAASSLNQAGNLSFLESQVQNILQTVVTGSVAPTSFVLPTNTSANFSVSDDGQQPVAVTIPAASTQGDQNLTDLVSQINSALATAGVSSAVLAGQNSQGEITFTDSNGNPLQISADANDLAITQLHLPTQAGLSLRSAIEGLPSSVNITPLINLAENLTAAEAASAPAATDTAATTAAKAANLAEAIVAAAGALSDAIQALPSGDTAALNNVLTEMQNATPSLQTLSATLSAAFGISLPNTLSLQFVSGPPSGGTDEAIEIGVTLQPSFSQAVSISSLPLTGLGPLTFSGSGTVNVTVGGTASINLGYDLTTSTPFLLGSTSFGLTAKIAGSGLTFSADIGSVAVSVGSSATPASITLTDANGDAGTAASVSITTSLPATAWIPFSNVASSLQLSSTGGLLNATLPIFIGGASLGTITVLLNLQNPTQPTVTFPSTLLTNLDSGGFDLSQLTGILGIGGFLNQLQSSIQGQLDQLPLIGHSLNLGTGIIADLQQNFLTPLETALNSLTDPTNLQQAVLNVINNFAVGGSGNVNLNSDELDMTFEVKGSDTYTTGFNANLGGLHISISAPNAITLSLGYDLHLGFATSKTAGFDFLVHPDANGNVFSFTVSAGLTPGVALQGKLFLLNVSAVNETNTGNGAGTALTGTLAFNLGTSGTKVPLAQLPAAVVGAQVTASLAADVNLHLTVDIDPSAPNLQADLTIHFPIFMTGASDSQGGVAGDVSTATDPVVALDNITLNLGGFFDRIIGPVFSDINSALAPIRPILDLLEGDVPVLTSLSEFFGQGPVTWADMIEGVVNSAIEYDGGSPIDFTGFNDALGFLKEVADLANSAAQLTSATSGINFGNYSFTTDLRNSSSVSGTTNANSIGSDAETNGSPMSQVDDNSSAASDVGTMLTDGLQFPILNDPFSAINILLGKPVDLVTWQLPSFTLNLDSISEDLFNAQYGPFYLEVDLLASLDLNFFGNVSNPLIIGLDSSGLQSGNFLNGFYITNTPLVSLDAGIGVGASVGIGIGGLLGASVGLSGELGADLSAGFSDPSGNPKIYFSQLQSNCIINLSGSIFGQAQFYITEHYIVGSSTQTFNITPPLTFYSFSTTCSPNSVILAHFQGNTLVLNTSANSNNDISVTQIQPGEMQVTGLGVTQDYGTGVPGDPAVTGIIADGGTGPNITNNIQLDQSVTVPATLMGAGGSDQLQGGSGNNTITGSGLNDVLGGNNGNDVIYYDGTGAAFIMDGNGNDQINTPYGGNTYIQVSNGRDTINGGAGNDTIYTGSGNDSIVGGSGGGQNEIFAGSGNNTIFAGNGTDSVFGGSGNSTIYGGSGLDTISAGSGNDAINGASGTYLIEGGSGSDIINGGTGAYDSIYGGTGGHNVITGSSGGYNLIHGGGQGDIIHGGGSNDTIYASSGGDTQIFGGPGGANLIFGGGPGDSLYGVNGNNTIYGGSGNETLYGGDGQGLQFNPLANGLTDAAGDYLSSGNNLLIGGSGADVIYGDSTGNNTLVGGPGAYTLANDTLYAGTGADLLQAGPGTDALYGGGGGDTFQLPFIPIAQTQPQDIIVGGVGINTLLLASSYLAPLPVWAGTVLYAPMTATTDPITVINATGLAPNDVIQIGGEQMLITAISGSSPSQLTVERGYNNTITAAHNVGASLIIPPASAGDFAMYFTQSAGKYQANLYDLDTLPPNTVSLSSLNTANSIGYINFGGTPLPSGGPGLPSGISRIDLQGGLANNWIQVDPSITKNVSLYGGPGQNTLMAGSGSDTLVAGSGTSILYGGSGDDFLYGSNTPSQDVLPVLSSSGTNTGQPGTTTVGTTNITLTSTTGLSDKEPVSGLGIPNGSTITSVNSLTSITISQEATASYSDVMLDFGTSALDGHDTLIAGSGNSELFAGNGGDLLIGGSAIPVADQLGGLAGDLPEAISGTMAPITLTSTLAIKLPSYANYVVQVDNEQMLVTQAVGNVLTVTRGYNGTVAAAHLKNATVIHYVLQPAAPAGRDVLVGGAGNDLLIAAPGSPGVVMLAGSGNDILVGENKGTDDMSVNGSASMSSGSYLPGAGADLFLGGEGDNYLSANGSSGADTLVAGLGGGNTLMAGSGPDAIYVSYDIQQWLPAVTLGLAFNTNVVTPSQNSSSGQPMIPSALSLDTDFNLIYPNGNPDTTVAGQLSDFTTLASMQGIMPTDSAWANIQSLLDQQNPNMNVGDLIATLWSQQQLSSNSTVADQQALVSQRQTLAFLLVQDPLPNTQYIANLLALAQPEQRQNLTNNDSFLLESLLSEQSYYLFAQDSLLQGQLDLLNPDQTPPSYLPTASLAQLTFLTEADNQIISDRINVNNQLLTYGANNWAIGGTGNDLFYGWGMGDTIQGGNGSGKKILVLQGDGTISMTSDGGAGVNVDINGQTSDFGDGIGGISGITEIGVQTGDAAGDMVTVNLTALPQSLNGFYVQLGNGSGDTINASTATVALTLLAGTGADTIIIDTTNVVSDTIQGNGQSTLDIVGSNAGGDMVNVHSGQLFIDSPTKSINTASSNFSSFQTLEVTGISGTSTIKATNTFTSDGSIPNVYFQGGAGADTTNLLTAVGTPAGAGTATFTNGSTTVTFSSSQTLATGLSILLDSDGNWYQIASGGTGTSFTITTPFTGTSGTGAWETRSAVTMIGGVGAKNIFTLNGPGYYTVLGSAGTNELIFNSNDTAPNDSLVVSEIDYMSTLDNVNSAIIKISGSVNGSNNVFVQASNMDTTTTSVFVSNGSGSNDEINASGMLLGVTLDEPMPGVIVGGGSNDSLEGGAGNTNFYYIGDNDHYYGGSGADNQLFYQSTDEKLPPNNMDNIQYYNLAAGGAASYTDGVFPYSNWTVTNDDLDATNVSNGPVIGVGGGDNFINGTVVISPESLSTITSAPYCQQYFLNSGYTFNPANTISLAFDVNVFSSIPYFKSGTSNPPTFVFFLEQGGTDYFLNQTYTPSAPATGWVPVSFTALTSSDFLQSGTSPNFTSGAPAIEFGFEVYVTDPSVLSTGFIPLPYWPANSYTWGVENFTVTQNITQQTVWPVAFPITVLSLIIKPGLPSASQGLTATVIFTDDNPNAGLVTVGTFTWGDGSYVPFDPASLTALGGGDFSVTESHIYSTSASYEITVAIDDFEGAVANVSDTLTDGLTIDSSGNLDQGTVTIDSGDSGVKSDLARNADLTLFSLHNNGDLFAFPSSGAAPQKVDTGVQNIFLGSDGTLFALDTNGNLDAAPIGSLIPVPSVGNVQSVAQASDGTLYRLDTDDELYRWQVTGFGSGWSWGVTGPTTVASAVVTAGGTGYASAPTVTFSGGDGTGATGAATIVAGVVTAITITNPGSGYTSPPSITITGGGGTGATATSALTAQPVAQGVRSISKDPNTPSIDVMLTDGVYYSYGLLGNTFVSTLLGDPTFVLTFSVASASVTAGGTGYTSAPTVTFTGGGGTGATGTATVVAGVVTAITITNPGSGYTSSPSVVFTGGGGTGAMATCPNDTAGGTIAMTLSVEDALGELATGFTGTFQFTSTDPLGGAPPPYTFTASDQGSYTFDVLFETAGTQTLNASFNYGVMLVTASTPASAFTASVTVDVAPAAASSFAISGSSSSDTVNDALPITVTADDAYGNVVTNYTGTVNLISSDPLNVDVPAVDGVATYFVHFDTVGSQSVTATDTTNRALAGGGNFVVNSGAVDLSQSTVEIFPSNIAIGGTELVILTARDSQGNQETEGGLNVAFSLGTGSAGGSFSSVTDDGDGTYSALFTAGKTTGSNTITATINGATVTPSVATLTVTKGTPNVNWSNPADISFGTPLGNTQLNASASYVVNGSTASVAGTFAYTPPAGTVLSAGNNQTLGVIFTPTHSADYTAATATASINVSKGTPAIIWSNPASISYGTPLGNTQLNASASYIVNGSTVSVSGNFVYTPSLGSVLSAGNNQTLSVTFTPTDSTDYTTATTTVAINVTKGAPAIAWSSPAPITTGTPLSNTQLTASASYVVNGSTVLVPGIFKYNPDFGTMLNGGNNQSLTVVFTPTDSLDYTTATATSSINVTTADQFPAANTPSRQITTDQPTFSWTAGIGTPPGSYVLWIQDQKTHLITSIPNLPATSTSYTLTVAQALTPGDSYVWYIGAVSTNNQQPVWSIDPGVSFSITALGKPIANTPNSAISTDQPTFSWTAGIGTPPGSYVLWIQDQKTHLITSIPNLPATSTSYTLTVAQALTPGDSYVWYIGAVSTNNQQPVWSIDPGVSFSITALGKPIANTPNSAISTDQPTFSWTAGAGTPPGSYVLWIQDQKTHLITSIPNLPATSTSYTLTVAQALTPGDSYVWYIGAVSTNNQQPVWSIDPGVSFSITALGKPIANTPNSAISTDQPTFSWTAGIGTPPGSYVLWIQDQKTHLITSIPNLPATSTSYTLTVAQALTPGDSYVWYIGAVSTNNQKPVWSIDPGVSFSITALGKPIANTPNSAISTDQPTFSWTAGAGTPPGSYVLWIQDQKTLKVTTIPNLPGTSTSYTLTVAQALTPGDSYIWYIGAVSTNNQQPVWSVDPGIGFSIKII